jgi:hypothetical protein
MTVWTEQLKARFLQLVADPEEHRYKKIAQTLSAEFGIPISKNMAIGIGKRLNVPTRKKKKGGYLPRKPEVRLEHRPKLPVFHAPPPRPTIVGKGTLKIEELRSNSCRWPFGDRTPYLYCGAVSVEGRSYCEAHMKIGCVRWQPASATT